MNADLSVAPELAQLAAPLSPGGTPPPQTPPFGGTARPPKPPWDTTGKQAGVLARLAAAPQLWWDLVRFDPDGPVRVRLPGADGAWLLILPPGAAADCDCRYATLLAGEAGEGPAPLLPGEAGEAGEGPAPLRPGRVRVRGRPAPHLVRGAGHGYSVSLHFLSGTERCVCFPPPPSPPRGVRPNHHCERRGLSRLRADLGASPREDG